MQNIQGKTGLLLSGGGFVGLFHIGVIACLLEQDLLPGVITGASAGSLMSCLLACYTKKEFKELIGNNFTTLDFSMALDAQKENHLFKNIKRFYRTGYCLDKTPLIEFLKINTKNMTFEEAY